MTVYFIKLTDAQIRTLSQIQKVLIFSDINNVVKSLIHKQKIASSPEEADKECIKSIEDLYLTTKAASEMDFTTNILKATYDQVNGNQTEIKPIPISSTDLEVISGIVETITQAIEVNRSLIPSHIPIQTLEAAVTALRQSINTAEEFSGMPGVPSQKTTKTSMMN